MEVNWIMGNKLKPILANNFPVEEDTKEDAFYRLLYWTVDNMYNTERSDPGNSKILVFANSKTLGPHITGPDSKLMFLMRSF